MIRNHGRIGFTAGFLVIVFLTALGINAQTVLWTSTTEQNPWVDKGTVPVTTWDNDKTLYIDVNDSTKYQVVDGWGGAINDYGWIALSVLSQTERDKVMKALFDTSGCAFNLGRVCIGANDYSASIFSCDDSPGDYTMANFSLEKEKLYTIPFALAAKAINPSLKFWASPHSPPAWMKQNNSMIDGHLKTDDATRKAYALYFQKYVEGMAKEGVPIFAVHVQNEPNIRSVGYPACVMSGSEMGTFIKNYLGPQFKNNNVASEIWLGTMQADTNGNDFYPEYVPPTLGDATTNAFISGVGMQWNAMGSCGKITQNYPTKKAWQTETQCGNFYWNAGFNKDVAPNEWGYGVFTVHRIFGWFRLGVNSYSQWNMVLDEIGLSNSTVQHWPQNSMISINKTTKVVRYNPQFYAVKHFSHFINTGAKRILTAGNYSTGGSNLLDQNLGESVTDGDMMAFINPNGDKVLVLRNTTGSSKTVAIKIGSSKIKPVIPANSINTFLITTPNAVRNQVTHDAMVNKVSVQVNSGSVRLTMPIQSTSARLFSVSFTDVSGKVLKVMNVAPTANQLSVAWNGKIGNGETVAPGVYVARISDGNETVTKQFSLQR